eukprot:TRINITY_DN8975_c0_g1_i1.p1 TRINITY_DN8975_c0_g1~~TRINITY_DN8975_c0_g1_i1.p1  ORF type:complete len:335 (-),score=31.17 TRINITY_DN8975_c0_g1_i1:808-1812(-)
MDGSRTFIIVLLAACAVRASAIDVDSIGIIAYEWKGTISLLVFSIVSIIVATACKQTEAKGSFPDELGEHPDSFENMAKMGSKAKSSMEIQNRCAFSKWRMYTNQPWRAEPRPEPVWGGNIDNLSSNIEWMHYERFPNGECNKHSTKAMVLAFWAFMWQWKRGGARWCAMIMVLRGVLLPLSAQIISWVVGEIRTGESDRSSTGLLAKVEGTPRQIIVYYALMLLAMYWVDAILNWSYEMEIPSGGPRREMKVRLLKKFVSMDGMTSAQWPAGRCTSIIEHDVPMVFSIWSSLFSMIKDLASVVTAMVLAVTNNQSLHRALPWIPFFLILFGFS